MQFVVVEVDVAFRGEPCQQDAMRAAGSAVRRDDLGGFAAAALQIAGGVVLLRGRLHQDARDVCRGDHPLRRTRMVEQNGEAYMLVECGGEFRDDLLPAHARDDRP